MKKLAAALRAWNKMRKIRRAWRRCHHPFAWRLPWTYFDAVMVDRRHTEQVRLSACKGCGREFWEERLWDYDMHVWRPTSGARVFMRGITVTGHPCAGCGRLAACSPTYDSAYEARVSAR